ncbi:extracellular solute-binding protein [Natronosporangium hydrolyticum]|uniref:Extracellular solute-binding protein n=1 Tax=Natronosporangium hydrolyticum TaxID=2811111 RepID=A0A895YK10_9ACTN|nr:extracellular solute-binding protein [Natronosporangium hydrolyticum]QSB15673.1 extracellular solute-binding protein [Natronosporangium hydrolyticum]
MRRSERSRSPRTLAVALAVGVLVAACGGDNGDLGDGVTEVDVWIGFTDYRLDWTQERADEFSAAHADYQVNVQGYDSYEALFQATTLAAGQGDPPAVVQYFEVATQEARDAVAPSGDPLFASVEGALAGRTEVLGEPVVLDDVVAAARDYYTTDGEFSSMPWNTSSTLLYANGDLLDAAGVAEVPATWAEIEAACESLADLDEPPTHCITWPNHGWFFEQSIAQQGGLLAGNDNGRADRAEQVQLDSPEMLSWVEWWAELAENDHYVYTGTQRDWDGTKNAFAAEQVAFLLTSSGDATAVVQDGTDAGFPVEVAPMPYNHDVPYAGNLIGGATLWLIAGLDEVTEDGALAFLQFLNNPENAADWHRTTGYIPITESAVALLDDEGWFEENPYHRVANEQLAAADGSPAAQGALLGAFVGIRDVMTLAMEDVLVSGADPRSRFAEATEEAQALLDEYNSLYVG